MEFTRKIEDICNENKNIKVGIFIDMDGVIADYDVYGYGDIHSNAPNVFLDKRPIVTTINAFKELVDIENLEFYIISACIYNNQAVDKSLWLDKYLPFIKKENRYFLIREQVNYNRDNKACMKVDYIKRVMDKEDIGICIYVDDEHMMLRQAQVDLGEKVICYHVSSLLD